MVLDEPITDYDNDIFAGGVSNQRPGVAGEDDMYPGMVSTGVGQSDEDVVLCDGNEATHSPDAVLGVIEGKNPGEPYSTGDPLVRYPIGSGAEVWVPIPANDPAYEAAEGDIATVGSTAAKGYVIPGDNTTVAQKLVGRFLRKFTGSTTKVTWVRIKI